MSGTGKIIDHEVEIADFTGVDIQGAFAVEIKYGEEIGLVVSTDDNLISRILISRENDMVRLGIQAPANFFPTSLKATITMPRIYNLYLSKGAKINLSGFKSTFNFVLNITDKSFLSGYLEAGISEFEVSGESEVILVGSAIELELNVSGASKLDLENFVVDNAKSSLKEASQAILNVNGKFDVNLKDASSIFYLGNPSIKEPSISSDSILSHK